MKDEITLREYETLREEVLISVSNGHKVLSIGLAVIGGVYTGSFIGLTIISLDLSLLLMFVFAIPLVCVLFLFIWLGEVERCARACWYLAELEKRINLHCDGQPTTYWHTWILDEKLNMISPYISVVCLFIVLASASPLVWYLGAKVSQLSICIAVWISLSLPILFILWRMSIIRKKLL